MLSGLVVTGVAVLIAGHFLGVIGVQIGQPVSMTLLVVSALAAALVAGAPIWLLPAPLLSGAYANLGYVGAQFYVSFLEHSTVATSSQAVPPLFPLCFLRLNSMPQPEFIMVCLWQLWGWQTSTLLEKCETTFSSWRVPQSRLHGSLPITSGSSRYEVPPCSFIPFE